MEEGRPCAGYSNGGYRADDLERIREELNTALRNEPATPVAAPAPAPAPPRGPRVAAICIRNAKKSYPLGSGVVLDGFNMTVAEGSM